MHGDVTSDLDRHIQEALAVDPSPEFNARVRMRLAEEPAPARLSAAWLTCGATAFAVVVVLSVLVPGRREVAPPAADVVLPLPVSNAAVAEPAMPPEPQRAVVEPPRPVHRRSAAPPIVLVPTAEREAFRRFLEAVADNRLIVPPPAVPPADAPLSVAEITIEPVVIQPIEPVGE
jgi:hypothetical protein